MQKYHQLAQSVPNSLKDDSLAIIMEKLDHHCPGISEELIEVSINSGKFHNYITEKEYHKLMEKMKTSPQFKLEEMEKYLTDNRLPMDQPPYFNRFILFIMMNNMLHRHHRLINEICSLGRHSKCELCYTLALDDLKSEGKRNWVRSMFEI